MLHETPCGRIFLAARGECCRRVYADQIHNMVCEDKLEIIARGRSTCFLTPLQATVAPRGLCASLQDGQGRARLATIHSNLIVGPQPNIQDKEGHRHPGSRLAEVWPKCGITVADVPLREVITSFSGLRAHRAEHEFLSGENPSAPGFVDCSAIESPGLTASPAIGRMVDGIVTNMLGLEKEAR